MKISIPYFKGEIPRETANLLPDGYASSSINGRLLSGDLTAWNQPSAITTLTPTTINSVYKMQTLLSGGNVYLRSQDDTNWAKGAVAADTLERIYFSNFRDAPSGAATPAVPKMTTFGMATGGTTHANQTTGNYPNNWLLLGVPSPLSNANSTPAANSVPIPSTTSTFSDGTSTTPWTTPPGTATNLSIDVSGTMGGGPSTNLKLTSAGNASADITVGNTAGQAISFQIQLPSASEDVIIRFGCNSAGLGPALKLTTSATNSHSQTPGTTYGSYSLGTASTFGGPITYTSSGSINPYVIDDISYRSTFDAAENTTFNISITQNTSTGVFSATLLATTIDDVNGGVYSTTVFTTPITVVGTFFEIRTSGGNVFFKNVTISTVLSILDEVSTSYVYTWVNFFGEEGKPSPASNIVFHSTGLTTTVTNITDPTAQQIIDYGLTATPPAGGPSPSLATKNLYRAATAADGTTSFLFVQAIPYGTTTFVDSVPDKSLGEALPSELYDLPPSDGFNILSIPNGVTVIASKNQVFPSVVDRPHAYPASYALATDFDIVGLGIIDTTVIVLTKANPYLIIGNDPATMSMAKLELPYGCVAKRSIANIPGLGLIYASPNGLVTIDGTGVKLVSDSYFTREQWQALVPTSIYGFNHDGRYFFFYNNGTTVGGYLFDPKLAQWTGSTSEGRPKDGIGLTKLDLTLASGFNNGIVAAYSDPLTDILYFVHSTNKLATWNTSATPLSYTWKSKLYMLPYKATMQAAQVKSPAYGSGITFTMFADGTQFVNQTVSSYNEFVLPATMLEGANELIVQLAGTATVSKVEIAETMDELS